MESIVIVGAGIFGLTASLELLRRGHSVTVIDPGPVPHPLASSNDTCRMVRMDYGDDRLYVELAEKAIQGWHSWNQSWGEEIYHETGFLLTTDEVVVFAGGNNMLHLFHRCGAARPAGHRQHFVAQTLGRSRKRVVSTRSYCEL